MARRHKRGIYDPKTFLTKDINSGNKSGKKTQLLILARLEKTNFVSSTVDFKNGNRTVSIYLVTGWMAGLAFHLT